MYTHASSPSGAWDNQLYSFMGYWATEKSLSNCLHFIKQRIVLQRHETRKLEILPGSVFWVPNFGLVGWLVLADWDSVFSHLTAPGPPHLCLISIRSEGTIAIIFKTHQNLDSTSSSTHFSQVRVGHTVHHGHSESHSKSIHLLLRHQTLLRCKLYTLEQSRCPGKEECLK